MGSLAALSESQANAYKEARPTYPSHWYKKLAEKTERHKWAWDVGTGNGQAAVGVAEYYNRVIATDINSEQLKRATRHPKVTYHLTPESMSEDELVALAGGENSVDLVTAAQAVHYFDLPKFYAVVKRVLRKPGGAIAVWVFNKIAVSPEVDGVFKGLEDSTVPFRTPKMNIAFEGYKTLPFPFENIGLGSEGNPMPLDLERKLSLDGFLAFLRSWQPVVKAKEQNADLLTDRLISEIVTAWGTNQIRDVVYKCYMIAGTCKLEDFSRPLRPYEEQYRSMSFPFPPPFPPPFTSKHMMLPPPCPCSFVFPPGPPSHRPSPPCRNCASKGRPSFSFRLW